MKWGRAKTMLAHFISRKAARYKIFIIIVCKRSHNARFVHFFSHFLLLNYYYVGKNGCCITDKSNVSIKHFETKQYYHILVSLAIKSILIQTDQPF